MTSLFIKIKQCKVFGYNINVISRGDRVVLMYSSPREHFRKESGKIEVKSTYKSADSILTNNSYRRQPTFSPRLF